MELVHVVILSVDHILGGKRGKLGPVDVRVLVLRWLPLKMFQQLFMDLLDIQKKLWMVMENL